jgi:ribosomal protein S18 acetylase RimI-like enzyme
LEIRQYRDSDEESVIALWKEIFPYGAPHNDPSKELHRKLNSDRELLFVASFESRLVGTVMGGYDGHRGWVYLLGVKPELRRGGIAAALLKHLEEVLLDKGAPKINLQIRGSNDEVVGFYQKVGYNVEDRISMGKRLY